MVSEQLLLRASNAYLPKFNAYLLYFSHCNLAGIAVSKVTGYGLEHMSGVGIVLFVTSLTIFSARLW
jgi:hypothetical protein